MKRGFDRLHVCTREHYEPRRPDEVIVEHAGSYHVYRVDYDDWRAFTVWAAGKWTALDPRQGERLFHVCAEAQYPYLDIDAEPAVCRFYSNIDNQTVYVNCHGVVLRLEALPELRLCTVLPSLPEGYERISMSEGDELYREWMDEVTPEELA